MFVWVRCLLQALTSWLDGAVHALPPADLLRFKATDLTKLLFDREYTSEPLYHLHTKHSFQC